MGKAYRKPTPSVPNLYWLDTDNCWNCRYSRTRKGCTNCRQLHRYNHRNDKAKRRKNKQVLKRYLYEKETSV